MYLLVILLNVKQSRATVKITSNINIYIIDWLFVSYFAIFGCQPCVEYGVLKYTWRKNCWSINKSCRTNLQENVLSIFLQLYLLLCFMTVT